ncbi:ABC transporter ATP-binding protein [Azospirillum picis]|uniref:Spermidine/putrescine transport system ATP-binding protein n=1 Tax=Azospirillum picis TaxID=488438 RepID=A0ABU0MVE7_9PROT|nr:ABC transporter ATP-binding protein [Azospirillum picis]MBP2303592.1 putative spermidine/putrescine transport system ATP-binding protein [Azospirillum picis]MDQ0537437.1 putative spermidine/putrescine transport system ATP-binding protein [Azospirillum picis]
MPDSFHLDAVPVRLEGCSKTWPGGARALEPLDLAIHGGETIVFLGPSGCGKTTTLRLIAGLESPDPGGRVLFGDEDVTALPIERRNVGMVFQSYALFPNMTVAENVAYGLKVRKVSRGERAARVGEMLDLMHLGEFAGRRIDQLSGGQRQRVALARALVVRPRVLLLDEPLTALDAKLRDSLRLEIDRLLRTLGITAVYVTHDQGEAMALGDRIVVMARGRVAQVGTPREIYYQPADGFVADFIGTMNRLSGRVGGGRLAVGRTSLPWPAPDGPVELLVRPEDLALADGEADGHLDGRVAAAVFLGDRTRLVVEPPDGPALTVDTAGRSDLARGDRVWLRVDPARLLAVP